MMGAGVDDPYLGEAEQETSQRREPEMGPEAKADPQKELEFIADIADQDDDARVPAYLRRWKQKGQRLMPR
jgi:hypothetical protein